MRGEENISALLMVKACVDEYRVRRGVKTMTKKRIGTAPS